MITKDVILFKKNKEKLVYTFDKHHKECYMYFIRLTR